MREQLLVLRRLRARARNARVSSPGGSYRNGEVILISNGGLSLPRTGIVFDRSQKKSKSNVCGTPGSGAENSHERWPNFEPALMVCAMHVGIHQDKLAVCSPQIALKIYHIKESGWLAALSQFA